VRNIVNCRIWIIFISVVIIGESLFSENDGVDPLIEEYNNNIKELMKKAKVIPKDLDPYIGINRELVEKYFREETCAIYILKKTLRYFFSEDKNSMKGVLVNFNEGYSGRSVIYIIEEIFFQSNEVNPKDLQGIINYSKLLEIPRIRNTRVIAFRKECKEDIDINYKSEGLLRNNSPGRVRPLRSEGPYEQYIVTLEFSKDGEAKVVGCEKDKTFDSDRYVLEKTKERIEYLMYKFFSQAPQERAKRLPKDADIPFPGKDIDVRIDYKDELTIVRGGKLTRGPWQCGIYIKEKRSRQVIPERYTIRLSYDYKRDEIEVKSLRRDEIFSKEARKRQEVAEFVREYLLGGEAYRERVRLEGARYELPDEGKIVIVGRLSYREITEEEAGVWICKCRIRHSGGFGRRWMDTAVFYCKIVKGQDGKFKIVEDRYIF